MITQSTLLQLPPNFGQTHFHDFLNEATELGASDVMFQTGDRVWAEIKGRQVALTERTIKDGELKALLATSFGAELLGVIKGGVDADRALRFAVEQTRGLTRRYRANITGAQVGDAEDGISLTMRSIPDTPLPWASLGVQEAIRDGMDQDRGLLLVCGPTGSGKTTLLSSYYGDVSATDKDKKIVLYEDPIEFLFDKVKNVGPKISQMQIRKHIPSFGDGIRNAMRRKPSVIGVGEARDADTIGALIEAALTGHLTAGTMHTISVAETVPRAIHVFPGDLHSAIASKFLGALRQIVVQILVPTRDGERRALREWLFFDNEIKDAMSDMPYQQWGQYLRKRVADAGQDIATGARGLLTEGLIDQGSYHRITGQRA